MDVLMINGSPHPKGNTRIALEAVADRLKLHGIDSEILWIGNRPVRGCIACYKCYELGHCVFDDELYTSVRTALEHADALIVGSPTYYAGPNGSLCALLDRLFYSSQPLLKGKPGASVAVCRRGGGVTTFERLNKYFQISGMPMPTSCYWNLVFGRDPGEAALDAEGMSTMQLLADNLAKMLLPAGAVSVPPVEIRRTNFVRPDLKE